jgi:hypothetical protein
MPAFMNIKVGSSFTTIGAEGKTACPLPLKKFKYASLISLDFIKNYFETI